MAAAAPVVALAARLKITVEAAEKLLKKSSVQHFSLGSTAISDVWYNSLTQVMWVKFRKVKNYPKYRFEEVPQDVVTQLLNSRSAGSVYHSQIKGNFHSSEISGPGEDDMEIREMSFNLLNENLR